MGPDDRRSPSPRTTRRSRALKIDLHLHTEASHDCRSPIPDVIARCRREGIAVQAVTDHDQIWGARRLAERAGPDLAVIVGEEISTPEGEIIGLFLQERIPPGLSPEETVDAIHGQGGLVLLPHGFDPYKTHRLTPAARERIADRIDVVEVFNARVSHPRRNADAATWAARNEAPASAGSDAHVLSAIGDAWVETPDAPVTTPEELLDALRAGVPGGRWRHPATAYAYKLWDTGRRRALGAWRNLRGGSGSD